jgi:hypothetical protein
MSNATSFSYSFDASPSQQRPRADGGLFAVDKLTEFALSEHQLLARNARTSRELVMPGEHFKTLVGFCSVFRTLDEHVAELMKGSDGSPERTAAIRKVVESFRDGGLTISAAEICNDLAPAAGATPIAAKPVVVIITCDRPQALERLLGSVLANCTLQAIDRLFVVDDSRSAENRARNRELTAAAGSQAPVGFHYFGAAEASGLMESLLRQLPEHEEAIRFLVDRARWRDNKSYGVARNFSHLLSVGKPVVVFDDDALCEVYEPSFRADGVSFTTSQPEAVFYSDHDAWRQGLKRERFDPVSGHLQCLGLSLPEALSVMGLNRLPQESLRAAPVPLARRLTRTSRVLITECGTTGDPGTGSNRWLANLPARSREQLAKSPGALQLAQSKRCCWLGRPQPVFGPNGIMSLVTGFDNRGFLPPYFPITRSEDRLFGQMVGYIYPDSVILDYPWAVPHLPMPERRWSPEDSRLSIGTGLVGLALDDFFSERAECMAEAPHERLAFLARCFEDLAGASDSALLNRLAADRIGYKATQIRKLQSRIEESADLPREWRDYLAGALRQVESSQLGDFRLEGLKGVEIALEGAELLRFWRDLWRGFGRSMLACSDIREAARRIVEKQYS